MPPRRLEMIIPVRRMQHTVRRRRSTVAVPSPGRRVLRRGIGLVDVLVMLGVLSLLLALILPALQSARESARRTACTNRLRQIGVALDAFQAAQTGVPAADNANAKANQPVAGNVAPQVQLLPYLDQQALFNQFDPKEMPSALDSDPPASAVNARLLPVAVEIYMCPSDSIDGARCNYRISAGTSPWTHETVPKSAQGALHGYRHLFGQRDADFADGKSQTTAFAEKLTGDRDPANYTPWRDLSSATVIGTGVTTPDEALTVCNRPVEPLKLKHFSFGGMTWALNGYPQTWYNHVLTPNATITDCVEGGPLGRGAYAARSLHPGGVNVLFADGRVSFNSHTIDLKVWRALGSVAGGETVSASQH